MARAEQLPGRHYIFLQLSAWPLNPFMPMNMRSYLPPYGAATDVDS